MWKVFDRDHDVITGLTYAEFTRMLAQRCIRKNSRRWDDYEQGKRVAEEVAQDSGEYQRLVTWAAKWVGV